jgi:hypothetical protein
MTRCQVLGQPSHVGRTEGAVLQSAATCATHMHASMCGCTVWHVQFCIPVIAVAVNASVYIIMPVWCCQTLQDKGTSNANMYAVAVADAKTAWAVGSKGIIKRYDGTAWTVQRPPTAGAPTLRAVAALGSKKAWAGGGEGHTRQCCCMACVFTLC